MVVILVANRLYAATAAAVSVPVPGLAVGYNFVDKC